MKKIIATIITITLLFNFVYSQDVIHLKNGNIINAKVIEISSTYIEYKPYLQKNDNTEINKQIKRKYVRFIVYENKRIERFYGKYSPTEYRDFCETKITDFKRVRNSGFIFLGASTIAFGFGSYYNKKASWEKHISTELFIPITVYDKPNDPYRAKTRQAFLVSSLFAIPGIIFTIIGETGRGKYNRKLKNVKIGMNLSQKQKEFSLNYRF